jgi:hypothetical protein
MSGVLGSENVLIPTGMTGVRISLVLFLYEWQYEKIPPVAELNNILMEESCHLCRAEDPLDFRIN